MPIYHHNTIHRQPRNYGDCDEMSPCTSNMILSAFLARIREMSSNRGVVSAVSSFAVVFGSAQGYCEGVKRMNDTIQIRDGSIGVGLALTGKN